jgi:hypothetical protein
MNISSLLSCTKLVGPHSFFKRVIVQNKLFYVTVRRNVTFLSEEVAFGPFKIKLRKKLASYLRRVNLSRHTLKYPLNGFS